MATTERVDPFSATGVSERAAAVDALARGGPLTRATLPSGLSAWLVTRHAEVREALADERLVKVPGPAGRMAMEMEPAYAPGLVSHMLSVDGADHTRLRRLVGAAFTSRRVAELAPRIQDIVDGLLAAMEHGALAGTQEVDLLDTFAFPLPMTVICDLIGVPEEHRADFRGWSQTIIAGTFASPAELASAVVAEVTFVRELVERKRAEPADDMLSALVAVCDGGDRLSDDELTSMVFLLVVAGHETTVNLIGNGVYALLRHPDQLAKLRANPELLAGAVEELLRFDGPVQTVFPLRATEPLTLCGVEIAAGELVVPFLGAANRDPARCPDAASLDVTRPPGQHTAFGHGIHYCLGAPLARLEAKIALGSLLRTFPRLALARAPEAYEKRPNLIINALAQLPVHLGVGEPR